MHLPQRRDRESSREEGAAKGVVAHADHARAARTIDLQTDENYGAGAVDY